MDKLQDIYYQPNYLWKDQKAIKKLKDLSKEKPAVFKQWLSQQAIWQVHSPSLKVLKDLITKWRFQWDASIWFAVHAQWYVIWE